MTKTPNTAKPGGTRGLISNALGPAAQEFGEEFRVVGKEAGEVGVRAARALLRSLSGAVWGYEKVEEWVTGIMGPKVAKIPEDQRVEPALMIAGPILDSMKYCGSEPHLREMFANLLATSMDARIAARAHPAFVDMVKQLSPDEAMMLRRRATTLGRDFETTVTLFRPRQAMSEADGNQRVTRYEKVFGPYCRLAYYAGCKNLRLTPSYISNLCRLEIFTLEVTNNIVSLDSDELTDDPLIANITEEINTSSHQGEFGVHLQYGVLSLTPLGHLFLEACVRP